MGRKRCLNCGTLLEGPQLRYCTNSCRAEAHRLRTGKSAPR